MPRPDLTEARTTQILDAFERCVARSGLEGTSLEQVAQEAGVKRSILRHYVGNREALVHAMARRLVDRYRGQLDELTAYVRAGPCVARLLEGLFATPSADDARGVLVAEALIAAASEDAELRALMTALVDDTVDCVQSLLADAFPAARSGQVGAVAYGVVGLCFHQESLAPLALPARYTQAAVEAARALIGTLER